MTATSSTPSTEQTDRLCPVCLETRLHHVTATPQAPAYEFCPKCKDAGYEPGTYHIILRFI